MAARAETSYWRYIIFACCAVALCVWFTADGLGPLAAQAPPSPPSAESPASRPRHVPQAAPRENPRVTARRVIGLTHLEQKLGPEAPIGRDIIFAHVEGPNGEYMPAVDTPYFRGAQIVPCSGPSKVSGHAHDTAKIIYGPSGLAPGVSKVHAFSTFHWLRSGYLRTLMPAPPLIDECRVFTHSWIAPAPAGRADAPFMLDALRRVDWLIDRHAVFMVVGVNNGGGSKVPALLGSGYNSIAVGNWGGQSSGGYTSFDGDGRCKPDIVAPNGLTSFATPTVAAVVARLLETADHMEPVTAQRPEVIKAVLMAGAQKPPKWKPAEGKPLDEHLGAGWLRYDNAHLMLTAGAQEPGTVRSRYGWNYAPLRPSDEHVYRFDTLEPMGELSVVVTWHRRIDGRVIQDLITGEPRWVNTPSLSDFELSLVALDDAGGRTVAALSDSAADNVEHVHTPRVEPGRYELRVRRKDGMPESWTYAVAWRLEKRTIRLQDVPPATPIDGDEATRTNP